MNSKKVLVTGTSGFTGNHVLEMEMNKGNGEKMIGCGSGKNEVY